MSNLEEIYQELLNQESSNLDEYDDPDMDLLTYDEEEFVTSKEIAESKDKRKNIKSTDYTQISNIGEVDENVYFKRFSKKQEHKYTEKEMKEIRKSCEYTIVHDYGENDIYHLSDEERRKNDMLAELSLKLGCLKRTYRKVDQYIEAMRIVVQAWEILEKNNFIHSTEEFFQMVSEGRIVSNRIIMPKLKKINNYNMDLIIKYISNPDLDPKDLVPESPDEETSYYEDFGIYDDDSPEGIQFNKFIKEYKENLSPEDMEEKDPYEIEEAAEQYARDKMEEEKTKMLLSPEEAAFINDHYDNPPEIVVQDIKNRYIRGYDRRDFHRKKHKKFSKKERYMVEGLHEILNKIQDNPNNRIDVDEWNRSYMITNSMFEPEKEEKDFLDEMRFEGSWMSKKDVFLYNLMLREELIKQHPIKSNYRNYGDIELNNFFKTLESNGVNIIELRRRMNCTPEDLQKQEAKSSKKENKKLEAALLDRISKLNNSSKFKKLVTKAEKSLNQESSN